MRRQFRQFALEQVQESLFARPRNQQYEQTRRTSGGFCCFYSPSNGLTLHPVEDRAQFAVKPRVNLAPFCAAMGIITHRIN